VKRLEHFIKPDSITAFLEYLKRKDQMEDQSWRILLASGNKQK
jgi:hypothetical protein